MSNPPRDPVTRPEYRREPYVRATLDDGAVVDGKATAWTETPVLVDWYDRTKPSSTVAGVYVYMHSAWLPAERVKRIKRSESAWQDPYDPRGHE